MFNITRAAHAEFRVTDLEKARAFYVDALGMVEIASDREHVYLGGYEERDKYSLILRKAESPGVGHIAFRVAEEDDLEKIARVFEDQGLPTRRVEADTLEPGQGHALRAQDP